MDLESQGWCGAGPPNCLQEAASASRVFSVSISFCPMVTTPSSPHAGVGPGPQKPERPFAGPGPSGDSSRIRGLATPPGS